MANWAVARSARDVGLAAAASANNKQSGYAKQTTRSTPTLKDNANVSDKLLSVANALQKLSGGAKQRHDADQKDRAYDALDQDRDMLRWKRSEKSFSQQNARPSPLNSDWARGAVE